MKNKSSKKVGTHAEMAADHLEGEGCNFVRTHLLCRDGIPRHLPFLTMELETSERRNATWYHDCHAGYSLLVILTSGELKYRAGGHDFLLKPGRVLVIPQGCEYFFESSGRSPYRKKVVFLGGSRHLETLCSLGLTEPSCFELQNQRPFLSGLERLEADMLAGNFSAAAGDGYALCVLLSELLPAKKKEDYLLETLRCAFLAYPVEKPTVRRCAEIAGVSPRELLRLIRRKTGMTPSAYRAQVRVDAAKDMFMLTRLSCKEVAEKLGYCNTFHLSREFRRVTGESPRTFRLRTASG